MPIVFQTASGSLGTSHTIDIGTPNNKRLIIAVYCEETNTIGDNFDGTVSVDGKTFTQALFADNPDGLGNHLEVHTIDETTLGTSSGSLLVSHSVGNVGGSFHVLVFYGVKDENFSDSGIEDTVVSNSVSVENVSSVAGSLVFMASGNGSEGGLSGWTLPLIERTDGPFPTTHVLGTASGIETVAQTNKTYSVTNGTGGLRSTAIVLVFSKAIRTHQMIL